VIRPAPRVVRFLLFAVPRSIYLYSSRHPSDRIPPFPFFSRIDHVVQAMAVSAPPHSGFLLLVRSSVPVTGKGTRSLFTLIFEGVQLRQPSIADPVMQPFFAGRPHPTTPPPPYKTTNFSFDFLRSCSFSSLWFRERPPPRSGFFKGEQTAFSFPLASLPRGVISFLPLPPLFFLLCV